MSFINVFVSKPSKISIKTSQLHVENEDGDNVFVPSDVNSIVIENLQTTLSSYALQYLTANNVAVFFCDDKHLPSAVTLPFNTYYRPLSILDAQLDAPKPLKKQLWQSIVKNKIEGQAKVLELLNMSRSDDLFRFAKSVTSDDALNVEAQAAQIYFGEYLAGKSRRDDDFVNGCLNYGYAIVRGLIARTVVANGLEPCLGLHHSSGLNAFNLADDLIEPFRPIVDLWIATYIAEDEMTPDVKRKIYSVVNAETYVDNSAYSLSYAIELVVASFKKSLTQKENVLKLPTFDCALIHPYA